MALTPGSRLGVYDVIAQIGQGGMGQVWRARDSRLNRDVALKVLPDSFANDPDRLARFTREAQTLAALNHPNIAAVYGLEESGGVRALVMELVEGDDLSQRIARGAIPIDEALPIAKQIAEAIEAAHEQGIIHRDLKPANIKVRSDGTVKVLDFGLAKALTPEGSGATAGLNVSNSPTITTPAQFRQGHCATGTEAGMILGTAAYMAPEQARGKPVDRRADIWSFGCVLYEMVTGRRVFTGAETSDVLAAVLRQDVDWAALPAPTPSRLRRLLTRCLDRDPRMRLRDIGESRVEIEKIMAGAADDASPSPATASISPPASGGRLVWMAASAIAVAVATALAVPAMRHLSEAPPPAPLETRTEIVTPATDSTSSFALSPDGRHVVYLATREGGSRLWLRSLATTTAQPLANTEEARYPFWSPDSRAIGFFAGGVLKRLDLGGGAPQILAPGLGGAGGTWSPDGAIVFAPDSASHLLRVAATGGPTVAVTTLGPQQLGHRYPHFLPDGLRFLFYAQGAPDTVGIYLGTLDGRAPVRLTRADSGGVFLPGDARRGGGSLLWVRGGALVSQRLDVAEVALTGDLVTLADGLDGDSLQGIAVSVAVTGLVAYRAGAAGQRQLVWVDRSGTARGTFGDSDASSLATPRVSPDGRRVVVSRIVQGNTDLWLLDRARTSRFVFDATFDGFPVWSPDGTRIAFFSARTGAGDLYQRLTSGAGEDERVVASAQGKVPTGWSADGRFLMYHSLDPQMGGDLWVVPMAGDRTPWVFLKTPFNERWGTFSPDGRWVAYYSNESGRNEVYVRPFVPPGPNAPALHLASRQATNATGGQWQVSTAGGTFPMWRPDGKELYYLSPAGAMMAAQVAVTGAVVQPGAPVALFPARIAGGGVDALQGRQYDVGPDGRFLTNRLMDEASAPITLLQNWQPPSP